MPSCRSHFFVFVLKYRHLLQGKRKRTNAIAGNSSIHKLREDVEKGAGFFGKLPQNFELTPVEMDLLLSLIRSKGRVLSREQLLDRISGREYEVFDRSVDVHISSLRKKLGRSQEMLQTVRGIGYRFTGDG